LGCGAAGSDEDPHAAAESGQGVIGRNQGLPSRTHPSSKGRG
jgi:hypothetical protein